MRAFVGLPVPEAWVDPLMRVQSRLPGGRAVDADDLHITLAFLDDQPPQRLEALHDLLDARALGGVPLRPLAFAPLGQGRPRAVVLDLATDPPLATLREGVRQDVRRAGIDLPRERFRPHVTLLRYGGTARADTERLAGTLLRVGAPDLPPAEAHRLTLWSSLLTPQGPIYEPLAEYPLVPA
ncbi:RNA 2',3'-cyclic phosphodiesterase [Jannaschia pagri]|uniref:RNA 2',3'-cyclic phosphodiesterase n=1 Tax=Jannaschia pagri TaxID=2829797 RepID=A0ABQ4NQG3_9RHOB|nr:MULTISPECIES: RNA 2',3'-cyclic phosphodiesterase [unclassified Jannaschia]GIT92819.1 RNA 2',3'-cyclic phosphodiesterase [Jannaschia sp. AI_61]GIT96654.1 RNA 2',3'-cyclic phosphodiesterase [Jannaschia sp. AI_62]